MTAEPHRADARELGPAVTWPADRAARLAPPAPRWLREQPFAHRGLHDAVTPENSLPAFEAAARAGYAVELDVMLSADRVPVVSHDPMLTRMTGRPLRVADLQAAELARTRLHDTDHHVPTLRAALRVLTDVPVMVELKQPALRVGALERAVATILDDHPGPWCVAGFNPLSLRWFQRHRPHAVRLLTAGPLTHVPMPRVLRHRLAALADLSRVLPHAVSYDLEGLPNPACEAWREAGGALLAWTAVGTEEVARARRVADNVIFERATPSPARRGERASGAVVDQQ